MKQLIDTEANLTALNRKIVDGFNAEFNTQCINYSDIQIDDTGKKFILLDEFDLRNPLKYLTLSQISKLTNYETSIPTN